ncbi:MAG: hypothetical protein MR815_08815 [Oscillospiraceae bacterium]|nr:hypothetical protein [Oscillospiraceae bacterium]
MPRNGKISPIPMRFCFTLLAHANKDCYNGMVQNFGKAGYFYDPYHSGAKKLFFTKRQGHFSFFCRHRFGKYRTVPGGD